MVGAFSIVVLKSSDCFRDDLGLGVTRDGSRFMLLNDQEYHRAQVNETHSGWGNSAAIPRDDQRNVESRTKDRADLVETNNFENTSRQVIDGAFLPSVCTGRQVEISEKAVCLLGNIGSVDIVGGGKQVWIEVIYCAEVVAKETEGILSLDGDVISK